MLGAWVRERAILCFGPKFVLHTDTSAAKITRHLADTVNYPLRFNQSRTRIKFEYLMIGISIISSAHNDFHAF